MSSSSNVLSEPVLVLNKNWQVIEETTVEKAITDMTGGKHGVPSKFGLHVELERRPDGRLMVMGGTRAVTWAEWITLPVRDDIHRDRAIHTHKFTWRAPTIVVCSNFGKMPMTEPRFSPASIWKRDGGRCQYTNEPVTRETGNLDHVIPRDRGGRHCFENVVVSKRGINTMKGNRLNHEVGIKLLRKPTAPKPIPASAKIKVAHHITWEPFLVTS